MTYDEKWINPKLNEHISNLRKLRVEINKAIEECRNKQIIGAALETEVNYIPQNYVVKESLSWLDKVGNKEVDAYCDWLIISKFNMVNNLSKDSLIINKNELGKIQILKAKGQKCDRCWHYEPIIVEGIENTKLCKRCAKVISL